ncbi:MAG: MarR family transcriptional regulator [Desulfovibrio sp.]|nr:MAG: MarR family transcriptional regulator [Desulfovibrio sp.]
MTGKNESIKALTDRLARIVNKHSRIEEMPIQTGENAGFSAREVRFIYAIGQQDMNNVKSIGDMMGVSKSAASQMIGKLEKKGLVSKDRAQDNDKEVLVSLTKKGRRAYEAHKEFHERHLRTFGERLEEFPDSQLAIAVAILATAETVVDERIAELFGE